MGILDDLAAGLPGGNVSKPLMIALGALLASKAMGGLANSSAAPAAPQPGPGAAPPQPSSGTVARGLGGLLQSFEQNGLGNVIQSWIAPGPNQPITPQQVHQAIGPDVIDDIAQRAGMPRDQLLAELSRVLPGLVDKATPQGRLPTESELAKS